MSALDSFKVTINPKPVVTVSPSIAVCPHDTAIITAVDTDPVAYYHWSPGLYLSDTVGASVIVRPETDVTYSVVATNQYGCTDTAYMNVTVKPAALLTINVGDSVVLYPGETYQLDPMSNCSYFSWYPPSGLSNDKVSNPVASPEISTMYKVQGITDWGCKAEDSVNIYISVESLLAMPNAFTPGIGPNNSFKIILRGIANLRYFRIFDRWGVKVFETTDINAGWDGTFNGVMQPFGVYVYEIGAVTSAGRSFEKHGNVTLIK
jgi:gliding motility-associated-like protein